MTERTIVYANKACYAHVYAAAQSLDADTVGIVCEYLPPKGRVFNVSQFAASTCDSCYTKREGCFRVGLNYIPSWDDVAAYICPECCERDDYETMFERGIGVLQVRSEGDGQFGIRLYYRQIFSTRWVGFEESYDVEENDENILMTRSVHYYGQTRTGPFRMQGPPTYKHVTYRGREVLDSNIRSKMESPVPFELVLR